MWKSVILFAFFAWFAHGQPLQVGVYMSFDHTPPPARVLEALQRETSALLQPAEILLDWRMLKDTDGTTAFPAVFVLKFKGACNTLPSLFRQRTASDPFERPTGVGSTKAVDGRMVSEADIQCDRVRQGLAGVLGREPADVFASALAQIIAHELFHYLTASVDHGETGLAKPVLGWDELGQKLVRFASGDLNNLRKSMRSCSERNPCR